MNTKEIDIIKDILKETLSDIELTVLKQKFQNEEGFNLLCNALIEVLIEKKNTTSLIQFLQSNSLSEKTIVLKSQTKELIEQLAELYFEGESTENITHLLDTQNTYFVNHINFLNQTHKAFQIEQRAEIKKKLEQFDTLNEFELTDEQIKLAVTLKERERLKNQLLNLTKENLVEAKVVKLNFRAILRYAAILILFIGSSIIVVKQFSKDNPNELALKDTTSGQNNIIKDHQAPKTFNIEFACGYYGQASIGKFIEGKKDTSVELIVSQIINKIGLPQNFELQAITEENAYSFINLENGVPKRYIAYNKKFFEKLVRKTKTDISIKCILAHEIGHHLSGHTLLNSGSRPLIELEADRFSGFILRKLGSSKEDALLAVSHQVETKATKTHPSLAAREAAIINGWIAADAEENNKKLFDHQICNMDQYYLTVRNKIMNSDELNIANSDNQELISQLDAKTLVGLVADGQKIRIIEVSGKFAKIEYEQWGKTNIGFIPTKYSNRLTFIKIN